MNLCPANMNVVFDDPAGSKIMPCDFFEIHSSKITEDICYRKPPGGIADGA